MYVLQIENNQMMICELTGALSELHIVEMQFAAQLKASELA